MIVPSARKSSTTRTRVISDEVWRQRQQQQQQQQLQQLNRGFVWLPAAVHDSYDSTASSAVTHTTDESVETNNNNGSSNKNNQHSGNNHHDMTTSRRDLIRQTSSAVLASTAFMSSGSSAVAADAAAVPTGGRGKGGIETTLSATSTTTMTTTSFPISASWSAIDGLNSVANDVVAFDGSAYTAMKDDPTRTPLFLKVLQERINDLKKKKKQTSESRITVLDLGTGPYALFAIAAANMGVDHVYAIEGNAQAAKIARDTIAKAGYTSSTISLLEGFSTNIAHLPELVDLCIAELVGSIATEEGAVATIIDARRFLKAPSDPSSWIPQRMQTYAAPASYSFHNLFTPPAFDWSKLQGEPVRFNCRDTSIAIMANPILVEDFAFYENENNNSNKQSKGHNDNGGGLHVQHDLQFTLDGARMAASEAEYVKQYNAMKVENAAAMAKITAYSVSGICFWPRLILSSSSSSDGVRGVSDDVVVVAVNSRTWPDGGYQKSHWQTVLPIMADQPIGPVQANDQVIVQANFVIPQEKQRLTVPPKYNIMGHVVVHTNISQEETGEL